MMIQGLDQERAGEHRRRGEPDPHIWLSPRLAKIIAANLARALEKLDPAHAAVYRRNLAALDHDLDRVDARLAKALAPLKGREFLVFHPAFGYFGDAYGLKQIPVRIEGKRPGPKSLARVIQLARDRHIRVIFVQSQFPPKAAQRIAQAIGGVATVMDPLARDYLANLERMASELEKALAPRGSKTP
jgi:zinc transport system substrate-binding protein